jgi:glycosyltransferase involved in cell wall biosynthesis
MAEIIDSGIPPKVSVIIPVFNRAKTIESALESLIGQTYPNWEAIAVDDGSTDDSADRINRMCALDGRIRLIKHAKNLGAQAARNTGIREARGEWIAFLDSDDRYLPESIELRMNRARNENHLVVHSECLVIDHGESSPRPYGMPPMSGDIFDQLLVMQGPLFQTMLVRREALERIGGLDESIIAFQEWDTCIRLAEHFEFGFEPRPTFVYDCRNSDTISKNPGKDADGYRQVINKHGVSVIKKCGRRALANHRYIIARKYLRIGRYADSFGAFCAACFYYFTSFRKAVGKQAGRRP